MRLISISNQVKAENHIVVELSLLVKVKVEVIIELGKSVFVSLVVSHAKLMLRNDRL